MPSLGPGELTLVLVTVVLVFIAGRLAPMGDALGRLMGVKPRGVSGAKEDAASRAEPAAETSTTTERAPGS